jgi:uncharacterized protein (TIGR03083 family)
MDSQRLRECLPADLRRLRELVERTDPAVEVPTCPGWKLSDLARHVGEVYLNKVECMRRGTEPKPWPPAGLEREPPLDLLDRSFAALTAEFSARRDEDQAFSWYAPDQSVRFWVRRMAQETLIHRVDAELAAGETIAAIPDDLAEDGIDEVLVIFVQYATEGWPEEFEELLTAIPDRAISVSAPGRSWLVRLTAGRVRVDRGPGADPDGSIRGPAPDLLLWLWGRGGDAARTSGDEEAIALFRKILALSTQ